MSTMVFPDEFLETIVLPDKDLYRAALFTVGIGIFVVLTFKAYRTLFQLCGDDSQYILLISFSTLLVGLLVGGFQHPER